jgi:3-hydroxybutyryl-CoA dehydrogenase
LKSLRVGVLGAGVMGSGIAQTLATAGYETHCYDPSSEALKKAHEAVRTGRYGLERGVDRGKLTRDEAEATLARLRFEKELEPAVQVDLVVECVPEQLELKVKTFRDLDRLAPEGAILASNTSGFSIGGLAATTDRPEQVIGWHWASPPVVMRFAEIVRTKQTAEPVIERVCEIARDCGKNPIVVNDNPMVWGFVANRIYTAMLQEAGRVAAEGVATQDEINALMVDCFNWPVGPYGMVKGARGGWS